MPRERNYLPSTAADILMCSFHARRVAADAGRAAISLVVIRQGRCHAAAAAACCRVLEGEKRMRTRMQEEREKDFFAKSLARDFTL